MFDLAQTNVQLCQQVVGLGWSDSDLLRLRTAYELAMWTFSAQYRANGKTQVAHHVGVASALATTGARPTLVLAGLVHSAYFLGEFGSGRLGPDDAKRARVTAAVGPEVEQLVDAYTAQPWDGDAVRALLAATERPPVTSDVVAMRLANEVDEHSDATTRLSGDRPDEGLDGDDGLELLGRLATAYNVEPLGELLRKVVAASAALPVPAALVSSRSDTVFVPPASYRRRIHVALQDSRLGHEMAERVPGARTLAERVRRAVS